MGNDVNMAVATPEMIASWFAEHVPQSWFIAPPEVTADQDELIVIGTLPPAGRPAAERSRLAAFRQESRPERIRIAAEAEQHFQRRVSWGARCGSTTILFSTASVPVMTRLRQPERRVLDTLVAAGVARSRSDALAWCVRLVGRHQADWIRELAEALQAVEKVRAQGPD